MKPEELKPMDLLCDMGLDVNGQRHYQPWKAYDIDEVNLVIKELEDELNEPFFQHEARLMQENKRLKDEIAAYEDERKCLSETITCDADVIRNLNKENAKLKEGGKMKTVLLVLMIVATVVLSAITKKK